jgi:hypothetical protein
MFSTWQPVSCLCFCSDVCHETRLRCLQSWCASALLVTLNYRPRSRSWCCKQLHLYAALFYKQKLSRLFNNRNTSPMFWFRFTFFLLTNVSPIFPIIFCPLPLCCFYCLFFFMSFCLWRRKDFVFVLNVLQVLISLLSLQAKPSLEVDVITRNMYFMFWF